MIIDRAGKVENVTEMVNDVNSHKRLLPLFLDLGSRSVVIFGGGTVGERKAMLFSEFSRVTVVSKSFTKRLLQMERDESAKLIRADLTQGYHEYLEGAFIIIPATSDAELNQSIELSASKRGILVNKVDGIGDVVVPSLMRKGPIDIAISTTLCNVSNCHEPGSSCNEMIGTAGCPHMIYDNGIELTHFFDAMDESSIGHLPIKEWRGR